MELNDKQFNTLIAAILSIPLDYEDTKDTFKELCQWLNKPAEESKPVGDSKNCDNDNDNDCVKVVQQSKRLSERMKLLCEFERNSLFEELEFLINERMVYVSLINRPQQYTGRINLERLRDHQSAQSPQSGASRV